MEITEEQLQEFIDLYKKELGISISPVEAQQSALSLLSFLQIPFIPFELTTDDGTIENTRLEIPT